MQEWSKVSISASKLAFESPESCDTDLELLENLPSLLVRREAILSEVIGPVDKEQVDVGDAELREGGVQGRANVLEAGANLGGDCG